MKTWKLNVDPRLTTLLQLKTIKKWLFNLGRANFVKKSSASTCCIVELNKYKVYNISPSASVA